MSATIDLHDVCYAHGTFFLVPIGNEFTSDDGFRGVVSVDAGAYDELKAKGLMDAVVQATMVVADNDLTDEEGWTGEAGLRTIKVHGVDPKPQLMIPEDAIEAIVGRGIVDGTYVDLAIAKIER